MQEIGLLEAIYSQRSFTRYKRDPVPRKAIEKIIDAATQAPSGGNVQPWEFIAVTDPDVIAQVGGVYRDVWLAARPTPSADESPVYRAARYLANHMPEAPALILVCADHSKGYMERNPNEAIQRGRYASSIWLAVQNMFLAARALGLGTRLTTAHIGGEDRVKKILDIPDHVETLVLTPLGYPRGNFGRVDRRPAAEVTSFNRYGNRG
jgi:nitroreductase